MRLRKKHWAIPEMRERPFVLFETEDLKGNWKREFGNNNDIHVEIGCGKGDFVVEIARRNPETNYVGIEVETNALVYATRKIEEAELKNVRIIPMDAKDIDEVFEEGEASKIYINFCNPWPKNRHHKRRLTYPSFLKRYKKILRKDSLLVLKTDDQDFFTDSLKYAKDEDLEILEKTRDLPRDYLGNIVTEYESKWRSIDKPICMAVFKF